MAGAPPNPRGYTPPKRKASDTARLAAADKRQQASIDRAAGAKDLLDWGPGSAAGSAARDSVRTGKSVFGILPNGQPDYTNPNPPGGGGNGGPSLADILAQYGQGGSGGGGDGMAELHAGFDAQARAIDAQYGTHIANLDRHFASGNQGIDTYSADLQRRDSALGSEAQGEGKRIGGQIKGVYDEGSRASTQLRNSLMSRLQKAGVGGADLGGFAGAADNNATFLSSQGLNEQGHQAEQAHLLQQMLNDRKFEGNALQSGAKNDLAVGLADAKANAEAQRAASQGQLSAQEASASASQKAAAAKAGGMSISDLNTLWKMTGGGQTPKAGKQPDFETPFKGILNDTAGTYSDEDKQAATSYADDLANGMSPGDAIAKYTSAGGDTNSPVYRALKAAQRENRRTRGANSALGGGTGGMSLQDLLPLLMSQ